MGAGLVAAWTFASAVFQPLFGLVGDRRDVWWPVPAGLCIAAAGLALTALAPAYGLALAGAALGGFGTAAFHPEAARRVARAAGRWRATGMSYLSVGGNAGYALGVLVAAPLALVAGPSGIALLAVPGIAYGVLAAGVLRRSVRTVPAVIQPRPVNTGQVKPALCLLVAVVAIRSTISVGVAALGPLYLRVDRGLPLTVDAGITAAFLAAGAVGTMVGGTLADRFGRRRQMAISFALLPALGLLFLVLPGWLSYLALVLLGAATLSSFAVTVVIAQELMPARTGVASGLVLGLGFAAGGLAVAVLGAAADRVGLVTTLAFLCVLPVVALALVLGIPETASLRRSVVVTPG
jgi:FSR family fosmidomycin resistance protein-like MFS transporter